MKFCERTLAILKNFSSVNPSLLFREGNVLRTISPQKTIMVKAQVEEEFDREFAIYDLSRFLGALSLFSEPEVVLGDDSLSIVADKQKLTYVYAAASTFVTPPAKEINFPNPEISFKLMATDLAKVQKAGAVLQLPEIAVVGDGSTMYLSAVDMKNPTKDTFRVSVGETDLEFNAVFKADNLKMLPGDYDLEISSRGIAKFDTDKLQYIVATEASSTFS